MAGRPARLTQGEIASELSGSQKGLSFQDAVPGELRQVGHLDAPWPRKAAGALLSRRRPDSGGRRAEGTQLPLALGRGAGMAEGGERGDPGEDTACPAASGPCQWCWGGGAQTPAHRDKT